MKLLSVLYLLRLDNILIYSILVAIILIIDMGIFFIVKKHKSKLSKYLNAAIYIHLAFTFSVILLLSWALFVNKWQKDIAQYIWVYRISSHLFSIYIAKLVFFILIFSSIFLRKFSTIIIQIGSIAGLTLFILFEYGYNYGRFNYEVTQNQLDIGIPKQLNGLKIVHLTDLHLGTFQGHEDKLKNIVDIVNKQQPDLIFFTGDMINSFAEEMLPFVDILKNIKAKYGKYAVLGNHDYGDYYKWDNESERLKNQQDLISYFNQMNIKLLNNENVELKINNISLNIVGTENWSLPPFRRNANIVKATRNIGNKNIIMLLSHDPVYWDKIIKFNKKVNITFSGHTHGFQLGIKLFDKEHRLLSSKEIWKGFYNYKGSHLYVSKGIGGSFYPGRFGIKPEISVFSVNSK